MNVKISFEMFKIWLWRKYTNVNSEFMKKGNFRFYLGILLLFLFYSCEKEVDKYYERPDWLRGNAWALLEERGNYSSFLDASKKAGLEDLVNGKGLCTVFAFDDATFKTYLDANGYSGVNDIPQDELKVLMGYHIIQYSYKPSLLLDFQPAGEEGTDLPGIYYKHRTFAKEPIQQYYNAKQKKNVKVFKQDKYLPVLSTNLFKSKKIPDYKYSYNYFFKDSKWYGDDDKFYVANAGVKEYGIPSDNGYVYLIDDVVEPLRTVYDVINDTEKSYKLFGQIYDRFSDFVYDKALSDKYAATGDSLYLFYHSPLPRIASEWTYDVEASMMTGGVGKSFNAIVPTDNAIQAFFNEYLVEYGSIENVPLDVLVYFIRTHVSAKNILLPGEIVNGTAYAEFGDIYDFDVETDVLDREFCSNGLFYGINKTIVPAMFKSVTGPLFKTDEYSIFRYLMHKTANLVQLINPDARFTLLVPPNSAFESLNYRLNQGDVLIFNDEKLEYDDPDDEKEEWKTVDAVDVIKLALQHIVFDEINDFNSVKYYLTKGELTYVMTKDGGVFGMGYSDEPIVPTKDLGLCSNGKAYEIPFVLPGTSEDLVSILGGNAEYSAFYNLLLDSDMIEDINGTLTLTALSGESALVFAPTNDVLLANEANIPEDKEELRVFLRYYFVSLDENQLSNYILPGMGESDKYSTLQKDEVLSNQFKTVYAKLEINQAGDDKLKLVSDKAIETFTINTHFPRFALDGVIYRIDKLLQ